METFLKDQNSERIDLHMPRDWNQMTVGELEIVARVVMASPAASADEVKLRLFLALTELEMVDGVQPEKPVEEQYMVTRRAGRDERLIIYLWQLRYWMDECMPWADKPSTLRRFPYPRVKRWSWLHGLRRYEGPAELMQNWTWRQYRIAGDYMSYYLQESNRMADLADGYARGEVSRREMLTQEKAVRRAKGLFLATLFNRPVRYVETKTLLVHKEYRYVSYQSVKNWRDFAWFPDLQFQVILFWWSGMMRYLQEKFPKVFRTAGVDTSGPHGQPRSKKGRAGRLQNPLEVYTRTTATMQKYLNMDEETLNLQSYTVVLQHLNDMIDESDRLKAMDKKK